MNLTRRDFQKLGRALTRHLNADTEMGIEELELGSSYDRNFFRAATKDLLEGAFEYKADDFTGIIVDVLMKVRAEANQISELLAE